LNKNKKAIKITINNKYKYYMTAGDSSSTCPNTKSLPDASQPIIYFFILTTIFAMLRYITSKIDIQDRKIEYKDTNLTWTIVYILLIVVGNYFINLNLTTVICGTTQWTNTLLITIIPWVLIFGLIILLLILIPGWLAPFSNTIGYGLVKLMGLDELIDKILKPKSFIEAGKKQTSLVEERIISDNLQMIYSDRSLLINEISPLNFENFWNNMEKGGLLTKEATNTKFPTLRNGLFNFVILKNIIAEYVWYLLCGGLVTSVAYNYIVNSTCQRSVAQMSATHQAYMELQDKLTDHASQQQQPIYTPGS
jgi:hypothetical protein